MTNKRSLLGSYWTLAVGAYPWIGPEHCPHDFRLRVETAAHAGFTGLGLYGADLRHVLEKYSLRDMKRILDDNGIVDIELEWLLGWYFKDERRVQSDRMRALLLDAAEVLGARHVKVSDLDNDSVDLPELTEHFAILCAQAAERGTLVLFEFLPSCFSRLPTFDHALRLARDSGAANGGLMLDTWHLVRSGMRAADLRAKLRPDDVLGFEMNDGLMEAPADMNDATVNHRLLPGSGEFDLRGYLASMNGVGYAGPIGVEVLSTELREWALADAATAAFDTCARIVDDARPERPRGEFV